MKRAFFAGAIAASLLVGVVSSGAHAQGSYGSAAVGTLTGTTYSTPSSMSELLAPGSRRYASGIRMGSFTVLPEIGASIVYDDNAFATPSDKKSDVYTNVDARVGAVSNWSRHALEMYVGGGGNIYSDLSSESVGYAEAGIAGRLDVYRDFWLSAYADYTFGFEPRGSGESFQVFEEPIETQTVKSGVVAHKQFNRLWGEIAGSLRREEFFDAKLNVGGVNTNVDQSFRDGTVDDVSGRVGYEFSPKTSVFLEGGYQWRNYEDDRFGGEGHTALVGLRHELTRLVNSEIAIGYMNMNDDGALHDIDTWTYRAQLSYEVTPLMTVALVGARDLTSPSQFNTNSNRIYSDVGIRGDYAIRRDVSLMAGAGYGRLEYIDTNQNDDYVRLTTGADYLLRPWLSLWANYAYVDYESNAAPTIDYNKSVVSVGVQARY
jgi:hypothetical protein